MKATEQQLLRDVYEKLPKLECKGLCFDSCGPFHITRMEMRLIEDYCRKNKIRIHSLPTKINYQRIFKILNDVDNCKMCPYLTEEKKCSIYDVRPLICRLWGSVESMVCPHGCKPEGGLISDKESFKLLDMVEYGNKRSG